nr:MAG: imidazolonepropionase [Bacillota bacterium]
MDLLIRNAAQVVTVAGFSRRPQVGEEFGRLGIIENGYVAVAGERIAGVGPMADCPRPGPGTRVIDAAGRAVLPGFVDPHTHVIYAGDRTHEFGMRLRGATYQEIARAGGGILSTVAATRAATEEELIEATRRRLDRMLLAGTTTAEVKSGYGLTVADELKLLRAIRRLDALHPIDLVPTFMGAHEVPQEYRHDPEAYVRLVIEEMLPRAAALAEFNDVFCEEGVFTPDQSRRILEAGKRYGLAPKIHADELAPGLGGAELAAEVGAVSADHLLHASEEGLRRLAGAGTVAVLLPGTPFFLMMDRYAPARRMVELGVPVALATDCNPGSCPIESMAVVMGLACLKMGLTPAQALVAATINAAHAIRRADQVGSIEVGKLADLIILSEPTYEAIPYRFGSNLVETVVKRGRVVVDGGTRV